MQERIPEPLDFVPIEHALPVAGLRRSIGHSLGDIGSQDGAVARQVEMLRRDGTVVRKFSSSEEAAAWRAVMRRACRAAGLRIRTGLANADGRIAWVYHVGYVLTEAENRAARLATRRRSHRLELLLSWERPGPHHRHINHESKLP